MSEVTAVKSFPEITFFHFVLNRVETIVALEEQRVPYIDLTYCVEGEMHYTYEGEEYVLGAGDAILYPAGSLRARQGGTSALYASFNVKFSGEFVPEVSGVLTKSVRSDTVGILESIWKSHRSLGEKKSEKCAALFYYLYNQLVETARENEHPHIKHIKRYIAANLTKKITLAEIAEAVHLVPHYCSALFSKYEGMSIVDFILKSRIELAKSLIAINDMTLSEISEHVGFCDYNYFARVFKRISGVSATHYRRSVSKN